MNGLDPLVPLVVGVLPIGLPDCAHRASGVGTVPTMSADPHRSTHTCAPPTWPTCVLCLLERRPVSPQHPGETYRHAIDARRVTEYGGGACTILVCGNAQRL